MRAFSNGGGVQSTAALILSAQGKIDFPVHLFSNVGEDSENPDTLVYVKEFLAPYAKSHGVQFIELRREANDHETLYQRTMREERTIGIPVRMANGAPGRRTCTQSYKRSVIHQWLGKGQHIVGLGISLDEFKRMRTDSGYKNIANEYPLIDLRLSRANCLKIIEAEGLPEPPKSSCWFCPYHKFSAWAQMRAEHPELFQKAVDLEVVLNRKRAALGKDNIFLSYKCKPLDQAIPEQAIAVPPLQYQLPLFEEDACESGYCMV